MSLDMPVSKHANLVGPHATNHLDQRSWPVVGPIWCACLEYAPPWTRIPGNTIAVSASSEQDRLDDTAACRVWAATILWVR
jgi:hypothetical protein